MRRQGRKMRKEGLNKLITHKESWAGVFQQLDVVEQLVKKTQNRLNATFSTVKFTY